MQEHSFVVHTLHYSKLKGAIELPSHVCAIKKCVIMQVTINKLKDKR